MQNLDETNNILNKNRYNFKNDNFRIKNEDYYCNSGNDKNLTLENSDSKKGKDFIQPSKTSENHNYVNIKNTIYNISLTPQKINSANISSEKKNNNKQKYKLPPTDKKKFGKEKD